MNTFRGIYDDYLGRNSQMKCIYNKTHELFADFCGVYVFLVKLSSLSKAEHCLLVDMNNSCRQLCCEHFSQIL